MKKICFCLIVLASTICFSTIFPGTGTFADTRSEHTYGPMVGAVTDSSAKIWFRVKPSADVQVEYDTVPGFDNAPLISGVVSTSKKKDYTGTVTLLNLAENTIYYYRIIIDGVPADFPSFAQFKTFPKDADSVTVGILTDLKKVSKKMPAPIAPIGIEALSRENPDFVLVLGDWDHSNPLKRKDMRGMHRRTRGGTIPGIIFRDHILHKFPVAHVWDDHDYGTNNSNKTFAGKKTAIRIYDEYWLSYSRPNRKAGIWHKFTYGNLVEVFMLDLRSQRDLDSYEDPSYTPGEEPNFSRDRIRNDPCRSMLDGDKCPEFKPKGQRNWFKKGLSKSTAKWKIVVSTVPWNPTVPKDDAWWDFRAEQNELLEFIRTNNITGIMIVSGDLHAGGAIDDGTNAGVPEMNVPITIEIGEGTTSSLHRPLQALGNGNWSHGFTSKGNGYGLITLSRNSALIEAKDEEGNVVEDEEGNEISLILD